MLRRQRSWESGEAVLVWKMPEFILTEGEMDHMIALARKHQALILDLRGNPGGYVIMMDRLVGSVIDHDVVVGKRVGRKADLKPEVAKTRGKDVFTGKLIVLVDSRSASAAELFARVVQLEKRGIVIGDQSPGSVMEARFYSMSQGVDTKIFYGASITEADLIMADGKSLEHNGVTPDEIVLPTAADLAAGRDPVLARAAQIAGIKIDAAAAGKLFPIEWMPD
jgi:C-terminal processing protease CtpA/Prc